MSEKIIRSIGWIASIAAILMYFAYIDQIRLNLQGQPGSVIQPATAVINCTLWVIYGAGRTRKDWPIIMANIPGIILGIIAVLTATTT